MASDEFANLVNEIDGIAKTLGDYANNVGAHIFNPSNPLPHFSELKGNISMDQLVTTANLIKDRAVDLSSGAISQTLYKVAGVLREANLRSYNKASFYQKAQFELGSFSDETAAEAGKAVNRVRSSTPEQNTGV